MGTEKKIDLSGFDEAVAAAAKKPVDLSGFDEAMGIQPPVSKTESGIRGAAQGLSFGFADEATAAAEALLGSDYDKALAETRKLYKKAEETNPKTYGASQLAGGVASSFIPGLNVAKAGSLGGVALRSGLQSAAAGAGLSEGDLLQRAKEAAISGGVGAGLGAASGAAANVLKKWAPKAAEVATGATGREQQLKFKPGSGRKLLDTKIVGWFDSPKDIAIKAESALEKTSSGIGESLRQLDKAAPEISKSQVLANLISERAKAAELKSNEAVVGKLDSIIDSFAKDNQTGYGFSDLWKQKRGFDKLVNWQQWTTNPEKTQANYLASKAVRSAVTDVAEKEAPAIADKLADERAMYSFIKPVMEASQRRAAQLGQAPWAGVLDIASLGAGGVLGSNASDSKYGGVPGGALAGLAFRRGIAPRLPAFSAKLMETPIVQQGLRRIPISATQGINPESIWQKIAGEQK